jgi:hypothetical protein
MRPLKHGYTNLALGFVAGEHGQDLMEAGQEAAVLEACGNLLRRVHQIVPSVLDLGVAASGEVLVHGDFGPSNLCRAVA